MRQHQPDVWATRDILNGLFIVIGMALLIVVGTIAFSQIDDREQIVGTTNSLQPSGSLSVVGGTAFPGLTADSSAPLLQGVDPEQRTSQSTAELSGEAGAANGPINDVPVRPSPLSGQAPQSAEALNTISDSTQAPTNSLLNQNQLLPSGQ